ncbi:MAG: bifunctional riboflavin kinase/FAD synthetase [Chloroflexi bacterium]|nr:bifunctional riboflavin kinase/FAD synthetase [Chloroflexota bacterium]
MQHLTTLHNVHLEQSRVTIGSFDGVHRGHQSIIHQLVQEAQSAVAPAVVVTFFPHPAIVLRGPNTVFYLTTPEERAALLADLGVDVVVTLPFDHELASQSPQEFMQMLSDHLGLRRLWVGNNFALGRNRSGNIETLKQIGEQMNFSVEVVQPIINGNGELISSSNIRRLLAEGDVQRAAELLGRWYAIAGKIIHGDGRGKSLGIPTANLGFWPERALPARGVYATRFWWGQQSFSAVTNVGVNPTFANQPPRPRVETHVMDFNQDLYGQEARLEFIAHLRPEQRFGSAAELVEQIQADVAHAREVLAHVS